MITDTLRVSGPADLVQAVRYLFGFELSDSMVLVGLARGTLRVAARLDLPVEHADVVCESVAAVVRGGARELIAVLYVPASLSRRECYVLGASAEAAAGALDVPVVDTLVVADGCWRSLAPGGLHGPLNSAASPLAAAAVLAGLTVLPGRSSLEALLEPAPAAERERLAAAVDAAEEGEVRAALAGQQGRWRRSVVRALFAAARAADAAGQLPTDADAARFGAALSNIAVRDAVWMAIERGRLSGRGLWLDLARRLPDPYSAAPAFLAGWSAWRSGEGALAGIAVSRALHACPGYRAAQLLESAVAAGADPRRVARLRCRTT
jgi:hypothetical protein